MGIDKEYWMSIWDMSYRYSHSPYRHGYPEYRCGICEIDLGGVSIDTIILDIDEGYLVTQSALYSMPSRR